MNSLRKLIGDHPEYIFTTQYCLAGGEWNTYLSFMNYYNLVITEKQISVDLLIIFHDEEGNELIVHKQKVEPSTSVQIDARFLGVNKSGLLAVAAIADQNLQELVGNRLKINSRISTGFYVTWDRGNRARGMMHEWDGVSKDGQTMSTHHVGLRYDEQVEEHGLIVTNPSLAPSQDGNDLLVIRNSKNRETVAKAEMKRLPPMGSKIIRFKDHFPEFDYLLQEHGQLVVSLTTSSQSAPLTAEWSKSGDFHFHHI